MVSTRILFCRILVAGRITIWNATISLLLSDFMHFQVCCTKVSGMNRLHICMEERYRAGHIDYKLPHIGYFATLMQRARVRRIERGGKLSVVLHCTPIVYLPWSRTSTGYCFAPKGLAKLADLQSSGTVVFYDFTEESQCLPLREDVEWSSQSNWKMHVRIPASTMGWVLHWLWSIILRCLGWTKEFSCNGKKMMSEIWSPLVRLCRLGHWPRVEERSISGLHLALGATWRRVFLINAYGRNELGYSTEFWRLGSPSVRHRMPYCVYLRVATPHSSPFRQLVRAVQTHFFDHNDFFRIMPQFKLF